MNENVTTVAPIASEVPEARMPTFAAAFRVWLRIGLLSFGGPFG